MVLPTSFDEGRTISKNVNSMFADMQIRRRRLLVFEKFPFTYTLLLFYYNLSINTWVVPLYLYL